MNIEKMREEFEVWYLENYCGGCERLKKCSNDESTYYYCGVQAMWKPWQASRAAIEIEFPGPDEPNEYASGDCAACGWNNMRDEAIAAIETAGLKVKS